MQSKQLLSRTLAIWRERGSDHEVAYILRRLSDTNRLMYLYGEGIQQAKEALETLEPLGDTTGQAGCSIELAWLLHDNKQLDAAEEAASYAIDLISEKGDSPLRTHSRNCVP